MGISYGDKADLSVRIIAPPSHVVEKWSKNTQKIKSTRIFAQVSNNLCSSKAFRETIRKGYYKRAKGCYKVFGEDSRGRRVKRFNGIIINQYFLKLCFQ